MRYTLTFAVLVVITCGLSGCIEFVAAARPVIESCLREAFTVGERPGQLGPDCQKQNDFAREHKWASQGGVQESK
jgi:hypothetical protein